MRLRHAGHGDHDSLRWVVDRFTPLLLAQARYRLGRPLRRIYDPEDLVNEVWAVTIPRLAELAGEIGPRTPTFVKFLSTTLLYCFNNALRREVRRRRHAAGEPSEPLGSLDDLPAETSGVVTRAVRSERAAVVVAGLTRLEPTDRALVVLRGIEQLPTQDVGLILGIRPNTVSVRYRRILARLRAELPNSPFSELPSD